MDGCGIFLVIMFVGVLLAVPFAIKEKERHQARLRALRNEYHEAMSSRNRAKIIGSARAILDEFEKSKQPGFADMAGEIYNDILGMPRDDPTLKPFALEMGRLAYGSKRKDKSLTVYDEQAILNDINAHM